MKSTLFIIAVSLGAFTASAAAQNRGQARDHRKPKARDHRQKADAGPTRKNEAVRAKRAEPKAPVVRDKRERPEKPAPGDRGKRKNETVRATRGQPGAPIVRDHREEGGKARGGEARQNEVVPSERGERRGPRVRDHRWKPHLHERALVSSFGPRLGKAGTEVTIRGRNFQEGTVIKINGEEVSARSISPNAVVFKVPKVEGQASITLSAPGARGDLVVGSFDYKAGARAEDWKSQRKKRLKKAESRWKKRRAEIKFLKSQENREEARRQREAERAATREQRREERLAALRTEWEAEFLADEQTVAELALHAQRKAKLQRMLQIAESLDKGKLVARIEVSLENEDQRHDRRMGVLKASYKVQ